ncbi:MAG: MBL fold metallo-hydrolase [Candidatus Polarisedimenticolia bacterium]
MGMRLVVLGSGSAGNATLVEGPGGRVLIDAGFSCRELSGRLRAVGVEPHRIDALLVTHEHADHARGAALFSTTHKIPVHCTGATWSAANLGRRGGAHAHVPVEAGIAFDAGGMRIEPFAVPHDAVATVGFTVACGERRIGYATDLGHCPGEVRRGLRDCDLLVLESNHDVEMVRSGPYPMIIKDRVLGRHGHLDNETAAEVVREVATDRTERIVLAHLSRTNNRPDLALAASRRAFAAAGRRAPALHPADQFTPSPWFEV